MMMMMRMTRRRRKLVKEEEIVLMPGGNQGLSSFSSANIAALVTHLYLQGDELDDLGARQLAQGPGLPQQLVLRRQPIPSQDLQGMSLPRILHANTQKTMPRAQ